MISVNARSSASVIRSAVSNLTERELAHLCRVCNLARPAVDLWLDELQPLPMSQMQAIGEFLWRGALVETSTQHARRKLGGRR
jgi:hypothetical protein